MFGQFANVRLTLLAMIAQNQRCQAAVSRQPAQVRGAHAAQPLALRKELAGVRHIS